MRVFFIGNVFFSRKMLEVIVSMDEVEMAGIATKSKSSFNADHTDLSDIAVNRDIPYKYVKDINAPHILKWIRSLKPDVIFCFGWSSLIKKDLLELPEKGVIGYHPAKLPHNRGRHPVIWALALGLKETGSTFFRMDEGADTGDIVSQRDVSIAPEDTAQDLYENLMETAQHQVREFVPLLADDAIFWKQQDHTLANNWRKRGRKDGEIDFRMSSNAIYNLVRALTKPYIGAHLMFEGEEVKIWKVELGPSVSENIEPGKVLEAKPDSLLIKTMDGSIRILEHEFSSLPQVNDYIL